MQATMAPMMLPFVKSGSSQSKSPARMQPCLVFANLENITSRIVGGASLRNASTSGDKAMWLPTVVSSQMKGSLNASMSCNRAFRMRCVAKDGPKQFVAIPFSCLCFLSAENVLRFFLYLHSDAMAWNT
eukprot:NODE_3551_length_771_cov_0.903631.p2 GENE.NODE_3551_length_771_cov_0.903631~~NODE_3551_length_771_cov_0.903631.p2  ORF type:complete len:129 (+),score=5.96 NODE_3551_length_771_cov_0.903631:224-610(+)